jgi:hypothetical protein
MLAFATGSILALARHPIYGLMTYVAVFYIHPPSRWWGQGVLLNVRWSLLAATITLLALLLHRTSNSAPVHRSGALWGFVALVAWIAIQTFWALDRQGHMDLLSIYIKFIFVIIMITKCIETEDHVKLFAWTHVAGCFYLGWLAFTSYSGGRLDGVGGPGIDEANAAALQMVTGILVAGSLFLAASWRTRTALVGMLSIMVNGLVTTVSRSGFLAILTGGIAYNLFAPKRFATGVRIASVLGVVLFALLTNDTYWSRISTIKLKGADIEGVDTGGGRLEIAAAQVRMFEGRPLGCGHMCTTVLSPSYLEERFLTNGFRASHNTFMSMLVDHGIVGGAFYLLMLIWMFRSLRTLQRRLRGNEGFLALMVPAVAAVLMAITVGDMFVQYVKYEARIWFVSLVIVMLHMTSDESARAEGRA